jgi:hypothetical protein
MRTIESPIFRSFERSQTRLVALSISSTIEIRMPANSRSAVGDSVSSKRIRYWATPSR